MVTWWLRFSPQLVWVTSHNRCQRGQCAVNRLMNNICESAVHLEWGAIIVSLAFSRCHSSHRPLPWGHSNAITTGCPALKCTNTTLLYRSFNPFCFSFVVMSFIITCHSLLDVLVLDDRYRMNWLRFNGATLVQTKLGNNHTFLWM